MQLALLTFLIPQVSDKITEEQVLTAAFHKLIPKKDWEKEIHAELKSIKT